MNNNYKFGTWYDVMDCLPPKGKHSNDSEVVLVTFNLDNDQTQVIDFGVVKYHANGTTEWLDLDGSYREEFEYITAWMPLPEPYKRNEE